MPQPTIREEIDAYINHAAYLPVTHILHMFPSFLLTS